jgi:hypothetical protein
MRQGNYLNIVLTVIALLLTALLWTQFASGSLFVRTAAAKSPKAIGIPNAAGQRDVMINELRAVRASVDSMRDAVDGGAMRVSVMNLDELRTVEP